jgi:hypothetical protein
VFSQDTILLSGVKQNKSFEKIAVKVGNDITAKQCYNRHKQYLEGADRKLLNLEWSKGEVYLLSGCVLIFLY